MVLRSGLSASSSSSSSSSAVGDSSGVSADAAPELPPAPASSAAFASAFCLPPVLSLVAAAEFALVSEEDEPGAGSSGSVPAIRKCR